MPDHRGSALDSSALSASTAAEYKVTEGQPVKRLRGRIVVAMVTSSSAFVQLYSIE